MATKLKKLKIFLKEFKEKHDKLESVHDELITKHRVLKEEFTTLKVNNDNLELAYDLAINEPHVATNHVMDYEDATLARKQNFDLINKDQLQVIDHRITTRRADAAKATRCSSVRSSSAVQLRGRPPR